MRVYEHSNVHDGYKQIIQDLLDNGKKSTSRVGDVFEIEDAIISYTDGCPVFPPRRSDVADLIGLTEGAQLVGATSLDGLMAELFPRMLDFTDFSGSYGRRIGNGDQIAEVIAQLQTSPDSRRCVITLWNPVLDAQGRGEDHPCTIAFGFRIRDGKLNMSVTMRSQDIWRGHYGDVIQFQLLHRTLATVLDVSVGTYVHHCHSLHVYASDLGEITPYLEKDLDETREILPLAETGWDYADVQNEAVGSLVSSGSVFTTQGVMIKNLVSKRLAKMEDARVSEASS